MSLSRGSMGLPAVMFRGSLGSFKGSSNLGSFTALCGFDSVLSDSDTFCCTLLGLLVLAHCDYGSCRVLQ